MPLSKSQVIDLLVQISQEENLQLSITETVKGAAITGVGAVFGAIFLGPIGFPVRKIQFLI